jgi:hypothetical protein
MKKQKGQHDHRQGDHATIQLTQRIKSTAGEATDGRKVKILSTRL